MDEHAKYSIEDRLVVGVDISDNDEACLYVVREEGGMKIGLNIILGEDAKKLYEKLIGADKLGEKLS